MQGSNAFSSGYGIPLEAKYQHGLSLGNEMKKWLVIAPIFDDFYSFLILDFLKVSNLIKKVIVNKKPLSNF